MSRRRTLLLLLSLLVALGISADRGSVKVGGREFIPKGLIFPDADPKSRVAGEGELSDGCRWVLVAETRVADQRAEDDCRRYYYRTHVVLQKKCAPPAEPEEAHSERVTTTGPHCPDNSGSVADPKIDSRAISAGLTPDGRFQDIIQQPDGTRLTITHDDSGARVALRYPDGTTDALQVAASKDE
jgi:hypothetical protein